MSSCPICLIEIITDPIKCINCKNSFCKKCAFFWQIVKDECPLKCSSSPWKLDLEQNLKEEFDGFIKCPYCHRLGSLKCPKTSCRQQISFEEKLKKTKIVCKICNEELKLFVALPHQNCNTWNKSFYFFCECCQTKICDCITKNN